MDREADIAGDRAEGGAGRAGGDRRRSRSSSASSGSPPRAGPGSRRRSCSKRRSGVSGLIALVAWLVSINLLILVFNLLPAYPMDGGRVARALAWWRTGDRNAATRFAANLGRVFGYLFIAGGIALAFAGYIFSGVWLALIGMVINGSARGAAMQTALTSRIGDVRVADVMDREPVDDPRRPQRRAGARRVLPPLPLALVPGRRRRPPLPRPDRARPRRRGPGDLPRQLPRRRHTSTTTSASSSATTPRSTRCSPTRTCAASGR